MKTLIRRTALTTLAILFLLGGTSAAFAATPQQTLTATSMGGVTNLGTQTVSVSGGQVVYAYIGGYPIDSNTGKISYTLVATQNGLTTTGVGSIHFTAKVDGTAVKVSGKFSVGGEDMGAGLPAGCTTTCTEVLPFDFIGSSTVKVTMGTQTTVETMVVESPYWNPYSGPIYLMSETNGAPDGAIVIVATYSSGTIQWTGAQVGGYISGTLGTTPVSGTFTQTSNENENLVSGTATDSGTFQYNTNVASLNSPGTWSGTDYIPSKGSSDCSAATSGLPDTCTLTGFHSSGSFRAGGLSGTFITSWGVPAYQFTSQISATLGQHSGSGNFLSFWHRFF